jgi:hypothetical protein
MKIPEHIKNKMRRAANLTSKVTELMREVDDYFIDRGYNIEELRSENGISLEELEYGNDVTDQFCEWFENKYSK